MSGDILGCAIDLIGGAQCKCKRGSDRKRRRLAAEEEMKVTARAFSTYGLPLEMVTPFQYLGRVILAADNDWPEVARNLSRARAVQKRMKGILSREGAEPRMSGLFLKAMVQVVFLFGLETWVVPSRMGRALGGFQEQVATRLTGKLPCGNLAGSGRTHQRLRKGRTRVSRRWRNAFNNSRKWSHSTSLRDHYQTCVRGQKGHWGHGWGCGCDQRRELIWRGKWKRQWQRWKRMGQKSDGGDVKEYSHDGATVTSTLREFN